MKRTSAGCDLETDGGAKLLKLILYSYQKSLKSAHARSQAMLKEKEMKDERIEMCEDVNFFGMFKGKFVPCIGTNQRVNYIYKGIVTTIGSEAFAEIHEATMDLYYASRRLNEASRTLEDRRLDSRGRGRSGLLEPQDQEDEKQGGDDDVLEDN